MERTQSLGRPARWGLWAAVLVPAVAVRAWNALEGPLLWGYDAWGHVAYALFLDLYGGLPWPDQGWSYFHPPLHYVVGAALARFGDADVLARGLALWGSLASLATAALAAGVARWIWPERPALAPLAFGAVALLPVHLFMSPMPGNEMTLTLATAATLVAWIANERRDVPTRAGDAWTGALAGLALLTKFSGLLPLITVCIATGLRELVDEKGGGLPRAFGRVAVLAGVALLLALPYYQRNVIAFGTPFQLSRDFPLVAQVEADQRPGRRGVADFVAFPVDVFTNPDPQAPPMLESVWGTAYANVWADVFRESDTARAITQPHSSGWMAAAGLLPTGLFAFGVGLALRDVRAGRSRAALGVLLLHGGLCLAAFAVFAWRVPIWSALKASYLLGLSLPFAVFVCRGLLGVAAQARAAAAGVVLALAGIGCAAAGLAAEGVGFARRADAPATAALRFYFGDTAGAQPILTRLAAGAGYPVPWLDGLGALALAEGDAASAQRFYARAVSLESPRRPTRRWREGQLAVATALAGDHAGAANTLDGLLADAETPELLVNRSALWQVAGEAERAEAALQRALGLEPELVVGWWNLAQLHRAAGRDTAAFEASRARREAACRAPRRHPHGLGTGEVLEWGFGRRALLRVVGGELALADLDFYRAACGPGERVDG